MKIRDYITLARLNIKESKKRAISSIVLVVISLIILFFSSLIYNSLHEYRDRMFLRNSHYRTISFFTYDDMSSDEVLEDLGKKDHIAKVVKNTKLRTGCDVVAIDDTEIDGIVTLFGADEDTSPYVIKGRNFKGDEDGVCIIPKEFYPYSIKVDDTYNSLKKNFINGEDLIGKEIEIECNTIYFSDTTNGPVVTSNGTVRLKVIGVYDTFSNIGEENECYVSYSTMKKLDISNYTYTSWSVIPDRSVDAEKLLLEVCKVFPNAHLGGIIEMDVINAICFAGFALAFGFMIIAFINILTGTIKRIVDKTGEIGMLKSMGYTDRQILGIYEMETIINGFIAFIIMSILSVIIVIVTKIIIMNTPIELSKVPVVVGYKVYVIAFLAGVIIPLIAAWFAGRRITRIPAGIAIREE